MLLEPCQERALAQLRFFLRQCRSGDFGAAYAATIARIESDDEAKGDGAAAFAKGGYTAVEGLERAAPYCCIRLPTGGARRCSRPMRSGSPPMNGWGVRSDRKSASLNHSH